MKAYDLVIQPTLEELIKTVNEAPKAGYTTTGGPYETSSGFYVQAITLKTSEKQ